MSGCSSLKSLCRLPGWERFADSESLRALDTTNNREECTIQYANNDSLSNTFNNCPAVLSFTTFDSHMPRNYALHSTLSLVCIPLFFVFIFCLCMLLFYLLWKMPLLVPAPRGLLPQISIKHQEIQICVCECVCCQKLVTWRSMSFFSRVIPHVTNSFFSLVNESKN